MLCNPSPLAVEQPTSSLQTWWLARSWVKWTTLRHNTATGQRKKTLRPRGVEWPSRLAGLFASFSMSSEAAHLRTKLQPFLGPRTSRKDSCATKCPHHQQKSWVTDGDGLHCMYPIYRLSLRFFHFFTEFGCVSVCSNIFSRGTRRWNVAKSPADRPDRWVGALLSCYMFLASLNDIEKWSTCLRCAYTWEEFQDFYAKTHSNKVRSLRCFCTKGTRTAFTYPETWSRKSRHTGRSQTLRW